MSSAFYDDWDEFDEEYDYGLEEEAYRDSKMKPKKKNKDSKKKDKTRKDRDKKRKLKEGSDFERE